MDKNQLGDPVCSRVAGLAAPRGANVSPRGPMMQKRGPVGPRSFKKFQDTKKHGKWCPEGATKRPSAENWCARLRDAAKTRQNIITKRRAPQKHRRRQINAQAETNNDAESKNTASGVPDAREFPMPTKQRVTSRKNTLVFSIFKQIRKSAWCARICARSSPPNGGPSSKFYSPNSACT